MDNKNLECVDELEDFDLKPAEYQTRLRVYDKTGEIFGVQICACHENPDEAVEFAKLKAKEMAGLMETCVYNWDGQTIYGADVVVETVITVEGYSEDAGKIFRDTVYEREDIKKDEEV